MVNQQNNKISSLETCQSCGHVIREEWNYCPRCEAKLNNDSCPYCDEQVKSTWEYCPHCQRDIKEYFDRDFKSANHWLRSILNKN